ncbi:MAG: TonB-dependent receptor [Balneolaceae bacterium]|nr:TonB-dependent receptor [Balneolaceae bacterium]
MLQKYRMGILVFVTSMILGLSPAAKGQVLVEHIDEQQKVSVQTDSEDLLQKRISLHVEDLQMKEVLQKVQQKSGVHIFYTRDILQGIPPVTYRANDKSLEEVMDGLFTSYGVDYWATGSYIILRKKELAPILETVRGQVTDAGSGETLPGVNVVVKGTSIGTSTGSDGQYELNVPSLQDTLLYSFIGYQTREIPINGRTEINITLQTQAVAGEELVVVGYGAQEQRRDLTGAISSVSSEELTSRPVTDLQSGLQGKVAGLNVMQSSGSLDGDFNVNLRGLSSTSNNNQPLWVVDGIPISGETNQSGNVDLSFLNPNSIESIEVLKGPSATAIYGSRGSNGVILVNTISSSGGETRVNFSTDFAITSPVIPDQFDLGTTEQYLRYRQQSYNNAGIPLPEMIADDAAIEETVASRPNNDWRELAFRPGNIQNYNLNVSGGSEDLQYGLSASFSDNKGTFVGSDFQDYGLRINVDAQVTEKLQVSTRLKGNHNSYNRGFPDYSRGNTFFWQEALNRMYFVAPFTPYKDENGNFVTKVPNDDPILNINNALTWNFLGGGFQQWDLNNKDYTFLGALNIQYDFTENITYQLNSGYEYRTGRFYDFKPVDAIAEGSKRILTSNRIQTNESLTTNPYISQNLTFQREFAGVHSVKAMVGMEGQKFVDRNDWLVTRGATDPAITRHGGQPEIVSAGENEQNNGLLSYFTRVNYNYDSKYYITATFRRDGSSRFSPENQWGNFPSAAVSWRLSEEPFLNNSELINNLKLRVEYGLTGNQSIPSFQYLALANSHVVSANDATVAATSPANPISPEIKWEEQEQINIGFDFGLIENRFSGSIEYYNKKSDDLLTQVPVPRESGFAGGIWRNSGAMVNKGLEFQLNSVILSGRNSDFFWDTNLNFSYNENEITRVGTTPGGEQLKLRGGVRWFTWSTITQEGRPISMIKGYEWIGTIDDPDLAQQYGVEVGALKYKDQNGDGKINDADRVFLDQGFPKFTGGFNTTFSYKNLDLSVSLTGAAGYSLINSMGAALNGGRMEYNQTKEYMNNYYTPERKSDKFPAPSEDLFTALIWNQFPSTRWTEKADYLRIQSVGLTYNLPQHWIQQANISSASVSLIGNNLHTFTNFQGMDPEATYYRSQPLSQGISSGQYPLSRSFHLKIDLNF